MGRNTTVKRQLFNVAFSALHLSTAPLKGLGRLFWPRQCTNEILILGLCRGIGDFALFYHPYQALRAIRPELDITVIVYPQNVEIASLLLRDVHIIAFNGWYDLYGKLRDRRFLFLLDIAAEASWKPVLFSLLLPADMRVGFYWNFRGILYDYPVRYAADRSVQDMLFDLLEPIGIQRDDKRSFKASEVAPMPEKVSHLLATCTGRPLVAMHPGARDDVEKADKRWPAEHFGRLAAMLAEATGASVIILGSASEKELCERVVAAADGRAEDLAGRTNLAELLHILEHCNILICNNSGLLHLAVLLGVPTVSFVGPVNIERWGPLGSRSMHFVVPNEWGECPDRKLSGMERAVAQLRSIPPEKVLPVVLRILSRTTSYERKAQ